MNLTNVFIGTGYAKSIDDEERLLEELIQAARAAGVIGSPTVTAPRS